ncbi:putative phenylacetaldoxime dehydratase [Geomicrobium sp. JCM 19037]|uniref:phenylacetaldoxime dehydratase family protein n=1 Tax=Geomicrobium sp. JCM 19037 TaxID=1460634 RepID=UPI00045F16FF|nr:phenylacetaldoxime dehydratase family protein [Geomicrobium sp. JCM 19037]GAK04381.1 putative phenylacetaldoxime dehydratase [Geomicrobium sp. JCM 19037]
MTNMPENHKTTHDSYTAVFPLDIESIMFIQMGIQIPSSTDTSPVISQVNALIDKYPTHIDTAIHSEDKDTVNVLFLCYFKDIKVYDEWRNSPKIMTFLNGNHTISGRFGLSFEAFRIFIDEFETTHSSNSQRDGVSHFTPLEVSKKHEYWGAMRDRIPASVHQSFPGSNKKITVSTTEDKTFVHLPKNSCFIRTVQDLTDVSAEEKKLYEEMIRPVLHRGVQHLATDSNSGCLAIKGVEEVNTAGDKKDIHSVLAYFQSLDHLEQWSKSHKTHLSIYGTYFKLLKEQENKTSIRLWHEVCLLDDDRTEIFYLRCKSNTGLLRNV